MWRATGTPLPTAAADAAAQGDAGDAGRAYDPTKPYATPALLMTLESTSKEGDLRLLAFFTLAVAWAYRGTAHDKICVGRDLFAPGSSLYSCLARYVTNNTPTKGSPVTDRFGLMSRMVLLSGASLLNCASCSSPQAATSDADAGAGVRPGGADASADLSTGASTDGSGMVNRDDAGNDATPNGSQDAGAPSSSPDAGGEAASSPPDAASLGGNDAGNPSASGQVWYPQDLAFTSTANKANPYMDVTDFTVTFTAPDGTKLTVPGFYTGGQVWKVRFSPTSAGAFTYVTSSMQDPSLNGLTGTVTPGTANLNSHGAIRVDPAHPHHYLYADGTHYFQLGYEVDWLGLMDFGDANITKAKTLIDMIASNGFSEVPMQAYAYDTSWKPGNTSAFDFGPPTQFAWAGTNASADNTKLNETYWQSYDRVIAYLFEKGITAHVFLKFSGTYGALGVVSWPAKNSLQDDVYFRFVTARYQAYPNVVWDLFKESFQEPDQVYLAKRLNFIKSNDAYHRLRTLHCSSGAQNQVAPDYYDVASHVGTVDFYTDEHGPRRGGAPTWYSGAVAAWTKRTMPYLNAEVTLYQIGNDGTFAYQGDPKEAVFRANMEVLMGGGYFTYYYSIQAWDVVRWNETPNGITWYKNLGAFMRTTGWYDMAADDTLIGGGAIGKHCLANPGKEYIVYDSGGGGFTLNLAGAAAPLKATWVDLYTGAQSALPNQSNGSNGFTNPWLDPALLHLVP
jgi:Domain of unknown function (DUF5060)/Protein of unknown function (DUF4038)